MNIIWDYLKIFLTYSCIWWLLSNNNFYHYIISQQVFWIFFFVIGGTTIQTLIFYRKDLNAQKKINTIEIDISITREELLSIFVLKRLFDLMHAEENLLLLKSPSFSFFTRRYFMIKIEQNRLFISAYGLQANRIKSILKKEGKII